MPVKPCAHSGCGRLVEVGDGYCSRHQKDEALERSRQKTVSDARPEWKKWYSRKAWKQRRQDQFQREPLCRMCPDQSKQVATIADHIVPHRGDYALFWFGELQSLCKSCHDTKKQRAEKRVGRSGLSAGMEQLRLPRGLRRSAVPLTIVCGPPASGKSTYVKERAGPGDLVIDLDAIRFGSAWARRRVTTSEELREALVRRNDMLRRLSDPDGFNRAWFIVAAGQRRERLHWQAMLGGELVVLKASADVCIERIRADRKRAAIADQLIGAVRDWWELNSSEGENHGE